MAHKWNVIQIIFSDSEMSGISRENSCNHIVYYTTTVSNYFTTILFIIEGSTKQGYEDINKLVFS